MGSYIDRTLARGETVAVYGRWPLIHWIIAYLWLVLLGVFVVGAVIYLHLVVKMMTTDFAVTNRRIVLKKGLIRRSTQELSIETIEGVRLHQSIWGRLFGYGRVMASGTGDAVIIFPPMAEPLAFRRAIEEQRAQGHTLNLSDADAVKLAKAQQSADRSARAHSTHRARSR